MESTNSMDSMDFIDSTESEESMDSTDFMDSMNSVVPMDSLDSMDFMDLPDSTDTMESTESTEPSLQNSWNPLNILNIVLIEINKIKSYQWPNRVPNYISSLPWDEFAQVSQGMRTPGLLAEFPGLPVTTRRLAMATASSWQRPVIGNAQPLGKPLHSRSRRMSGVAPGVRAKHY